MADCSAAVLCNGNPPSKELLERQLAGVGAVFCADGAARWALACGVRIDVLVGDMDSLDEQTLGAIERTGAEIMRLSREKDETDTQTAVELAVSRGARELVLLGATGTRLDHTLGNLQLLVACCRAGISARMVDEHNEIVVTDSRIDFDRESGTLLSVVPLGGNVCVTTHGLYYPLDHHLFDLGKPLGISNVFVGKRGGVEVHSGFAAVILARD